MLKIRIVRFPEAIADEVVTTFVRLENSEVSIGRGSTCSLILPDPNRLVSRVHCTITPVGGQWLLVVKSTSNRVVIGSQELEFGQSKILSDGDFIIICEFALQVEEDSGIGEPSPLLFAVQPAMPPIGPQSAASAGPFDDLLFGASTEGAPISNPVVDTNPFFDEFDDLLGVGRQEAVSKDSSFPTLTVSGDMGIMSSMAPSKDPFDALTGPDVLGLSVTFGQSIVEPHAKELSPTSGINSTSPIHERLPGLFSLDSSENAKHPVLPLANDNQSSVPVMSATKMALKATRDVQATEIRQILLEGLNMEPARLVGISDEELVKRVSVLLRGSLGVIVKLLQLRMHLKQEVGVERTSMNPNVNNPIKFSPNVDVALAYVLGDRMPGFMSYEHAIQEVVDDIINHDSVLLSAGQSACKDLLRQLSPESIEREVEQAGGLSMKLPLQKEAKAWVRYKQVYEFCSANLDITLKKAFR